MNKIFLLFLLFLLSKNSNSQNWKLVANGTDGTKWYVRTTYVSKDKEAYRNLIKVWIKRTNQTTKIFKKNGEIIVKNATIRSLREYDCVNKQSRLLKSITYNSKGDVIDTLEVSSFLLKWNDVVPDTISEEVLNNICEMFS